MDIGKLGETNLFAKPLMSNEWHHAQHFQGHHPGPKGEMPKSVIALETHVGGHSLTNFSNSLLLDTIYTQQQRVPLTE